MTEYYYARDGRRAGGCAESRILELNLRRRDWGRFLGRGKVSTLLVERNHEQ